ncbi:MAG: hypothetical protein K0R10_2239 [Alphaproteobacteria bacterium]|jgi:hypothetical protein|nr:hypothetical protein [Alphaproteobacteria bacterium]
MLAPVISLLSIAHLLLQLVLAVTCLFLFFSAASGAKPYFPDGVNGLLGLIGAICALQGKQIQRDWVIGKQPNYVRIIAMAWTVCFAVYALIVLKEPVVAVIALMSIIYMMLRFAPEPVEEKKPEAVKVAEKTAEEKPLIDEPKA